MNIVDIAAAAGVSTATVSRVLNNGRVSPEARAKVEAVIRQVNYLPNHLARGLITGQTMNIGIVTHSLSNSYSWEFVEAVGLRLRPLGYHQFVTSAAGGPEEEAQYLSRLLSQRVDGIIVHDPSLENLSSGFLGQVAQRVPCVVVHPYLDQVGGVHSIMVDQALGMAKVMKHFLDLGHRQIWFVRSQGYSQDLKQKVWAEALTAAGQNPDPEAVVYIPDGDVEEAVREADEALTQVLRQRGAPTAIFACNDLMAVGCQLALRRLGLRIPEDVSLVGHDNTFLASITGLTSVDMKRPSVGHATVDLLLSAIQGHDKEPRRVLINPDLVERGSTAAPNRF